MPFPPLALVNTATSPFAEYSGSVGAARVTVLRQVATHEEISSYREALLPYEAAGFDVSPDSIDRRPRFEIYVLRRNTGAALKSDDGRTSAAYDHPVLWPLVRPAVDRLEQWVREHDGCAACTACSVLFRRYRHGERRGVNFHYDVGGYRTIVLDASTEEYEGGLLARDERSSSPSSDRQLPLSGGDAIVHSFDLAHSVNVTRGERWSLIIWMADRPECGGPYTSWYEEAAAGGDAVASHHLGSLYRSGSGADASRLSRTERLTLARKYYAVASAGGISSAQVHLAQMCWGGDGGPRDVGKAIELWTAAAHAGERDACRNLGMWTMEHLGKAAEGVKWLKRAAELGDARAGLSLSEAYEAGRGVRADAGEAERWLRMAASLWLDEAVVKLARRLLRDDDDLEVLEAKALLRRGIALELPLATKMASEKGCDVGQAAAPFGYLEVIYESGMPDGGVDGSEWMLIRSAAVDIHWSSEMQKQMLAPQEAFDVLIVQARMPDGRISPKVEDINNGRIEPTLTLFVRSAEMRPFLEHSAPSGDGKPSVAHAVLQFLTYYAKRSMVITGGVAAVPVKRRGVRVEHDEL